MKAVIGTGSPGPETEGHEDCRCPEVRTSEARKDQVRLAKTCQVKPSDSYHASNAWERSANDATYPWSGKGEAPAKSQAAAGESVTSTTSESPEDVEAWARCSTI